MAPCLLLSVAVRGQGAPTLRVPAQALGERLGRGRRAGQDHRGHPASRLVLEEARSGEWTTAVQATDKDGKMVLTSIPYRQAR
jgi:hypothetical protein